MENYRSNSEDLGCILTLSGYSNLRLDQISVDLQESQFLLSKYLVKYHPRLICSVNLNRFFFSPSLEFRNERDECCHESDEIFSRSSCTKQFCEELASGKLYKSSRSGKSHVFYR